MESKIKIIGEKTVKCITVNYNGHDYVKIGNTWYSWNMGVFSFPGSIVTEIECAYIQERHNNENQD